MDVNNFVKVIRVGRSLAFVIPVPVREALNLKRGDYLGLAVVDENTIIVQRLKIVASDEVEGTRDAALPIIKHE